MKNTITIAALALACGFAFGDSISNLSQIVGRDITRKNTLEVPHFLRYENRRAPENKG